MIRKHVVMAVFKRNLAGYFGSPTGYVFMNIYIALTGLCAFWPERFFANNIASLETLNALYPYLLLFFVPTITMGVWAEERRQGTDELLMTLPVRDIELVLGKYLAVLGIFTASLAFSFPLALVLEVLGAPDYGVVLGTYLGYWLLGSALLAVGMAGSLLTGSMTVAFILGAVFCAVPIFLGEAGAVTSGALQHWIAAAGALEPFRDLTGGTLSARAILYFSTLTVSMLYLNLVLLARRHVAGGPDSAPVWAHFSVRSVSVLVAGIAATVLGSRFGSRLDLTQERLHSLTPQTRELIQKVDPGKPVLIQAFISRDVPRTLVETRENLLALLREYAAIGGDRIQLRFVETERYTPEAREAEEKFGIRPEHVEELAEGERAEADVFLGVALTCGTEEAVIPFFHRGLSIEYELTRSIGVIKGDKRKKIGIASTDAKLFGGFDMERMAQSPQWQIIDELRKQYEVREVSLDQPVAEQVDVLLVAMPSSLTQPQLDNLTSYMKLGNPTLLFDDAFPFFNPALAPTEPKSGGRNRMMGGGPPPEQKGDIMKLTMMLGITWPVMEIVWDVYNPHPTLNVPKEVVFIGPGSGASDAFNPMDPVSAGLQEIVYLVGGRVSPLAGSPLKVTPLIKATSNSGALRIDEVFRRSFMGFGGFNPQRVHRASGIENILAARIEGTLPAPAPPPRDPDSKDEPASPPGEPSKFRVIFVADLDFISDQFFDLRRQGSEEYDFDNVTFILNCVDTLSGDEDYVAIRKRRRKHRTLDLIEQKTKSHREDTARQVTAAEEESKKKLEEAEGRVKAKVEELRKRTDLDIRTKDIMLATLEQRENRMLEVEKKNINDVKEAAVGRSQTDLKVAVRGIKLATKWIAVLLTPVPAILVGLFVLLSRLTSGQGV